MPAYSASEHTVLNSHFKISNPKPNDWYSADIILKYVFALYMISHGLMRQVFWDTH